jgi:hypothetical protein
MEFVVELPEEFNAQSEAGRLNPRSFNPETLDPKL